MDKLGKLLKEGRTKKGLTQVEVGSSLGWGRGCLYGHMENATPTGPNKHVRVPQKDVLKRLGKMYKIPYEELAEAAIERFVVNKRKSYF